MSYLLALHLLSQASLAVDCAQTMQIKKYEVSWERNTFETNPILGRHPSNTKIIAYFAVVITANELVYQHGPRWLSTSTSIGVVSLEAPTIGKNWKLGLTLGF